MASSDEEGEIVPKCVTNYHFVNHVEEPVSFTTLPLQWGPNESLVQSGRQVFLLATAEDDGLQKVFKRVIAWKFDLSFVQPEISVLSKDMNWIALQKPRKSFENTIRTVFVTLHWLHFLKKSPEALGKDLWNYLTRVFSSFEVEPSGKDLLDHIALITEAVRRDKDLAKCMYLLTYMEKPGNGTAFDEDVQIKKKPKFIVDMDNVDEDDGECFDEDDELYDHVCTICDNGGEIVCCQGRCMRSFHATIDAGGYTCESLGYDDAQVKAIPTFLCANCKYMQHQCFVCGKLGSSDNSLSAEVFPCISATCGNFYHPQCVAKLLQPANKSQAEELQNRIAAGESFTCPVHKCFVCKQGENKKVHELQFAICRRCPKAYHRKCLPRTITFEKDRDRNIMQRAWDGLLPNRILMYCMDHEIIREIETPARDHLKFPDVKGQHKSHSSWPHSSKPRATVSMRINGSKTLAAKGQVVKHPKQFEKVGCSFITGQSTQNIRKRSAGPGFGLLTKPNTNDGVKKSSTKNIGHAPHRFFSTTERKLPMQNTSSISLKTYPVKSKWPIASASGKKATEEHDIKKEKKLPSSVQAEMEKRILALMEESTSSFNHEEFTKAQQLPATCGLFSGNLLDKTITTGKVEGSVMAIRTASKKLREGCSVEDAKAVCEPEILAQIFKWKRKLSIYLAPFLHGMRYTSFGRHFTKVDKLKEVVDRLHCYVQDGDTIVDFCCGSNDFSLLMKEKLENTGKQCFFKNYDLLIAKNDFSFEQRDWMSVKLNELPDGSQLIMGLNPPFGVKASLANRFIRKALEFRPKLLILIVPKETKRLDQTGFPYDLVWEDQVILSGKSFYLPGSVDMHNKQLEDWNLKTPPLYLWSRRDWSANYKEIARRHRHVFQEAPLHVEGNDNVNSYLMEEKYDCYQDCSSLYASGDLSSILDDVLDYNDLAEPEGTGASIQDKVLQSSFYGDGIHISCKNSLNGIECEERGQTEKLIPPNWDGFVPSDKWH
ncbi:protein ENHANCED DOWNY MILDEW 2 isoform X1 [Morus notabilis]|uniref:protein ENHANCED DOWNY MILDEW 2 isoform X1 n=1 Tax=Morus notabilis TaxID=981085 RepID=UPI000CED0DD2|nr:protein ENHANCED DOWNY MILDEW 2 isoform X1 [Morus notabilis]